jgi:hypothetical protein
MLLLRLVRDTTELALAHIHMRFPPNTPLQMLLQQSCLYNLMVCTPLSSLLTTATVNLCKKKNLLDSLLISVKV